MSGIGGVSWQVYKNLPPEDQQAIRDAAAKPPQVQAEPAADPAPPPAPPPAKPADAQTPQEAVASINAQPLPKTDDLGGMPGPVFDSIYKPRVEQFTTTRREDAQAALDRMEPKLEDFRNSGLNGATANMEYQESRNAFNSNPYVKELQRIVTEATDKPTQVPSYLTNQSTQADPSAVSNLKLDSVRTALDTLGVKLPENPTPQQIASGYELLGALPQDVLSYAINPGTAVTYTTPVAGISTPSFIPARVGADVVVEGKVELSDVQTGVDFEQTQQFKASVEVRGEAGLDVGKTPLNHLYKAATLLRQVSDETKQMVESSPLLRNVVKGLPVSGHLVAFEGTRLSYEATVTPQQGAKLDAGDMSAMPNPLDPQAMPQGTSVLMRGQNLTGSDFAINYKMYGGIGGTHTELDGAGFGVRKMEGSVVEVYAGPMETVENATMFGLGKVGTASIGLSVETSMENRSLQTARIDLSTPEGQQAYQTFMSGGKIPDWNPPGVQRSGTTEVFNAEHAARLGIDAGPISIGVGNSSQLTITRNVWQDGTIDQTNSYQGAGQTTEVKFQLGADGKPLTDSTEWTLVLPNTSDVAASYFNSSYRPGELNKKFDGEQHLQFEFTDKDLMSLRDRARESVGNLGGDEHGGERLKDLDAGRITPFPNDLTEQIAIAKTPDEVFAAISRSGQAGCEDFVTMMMWGDQRNTALPGTFQIKDAG
ncbi:hypothetical protein AZ78_2366 [Lysobacter capsici AZ78]|uniref:Uncharacterized protein n=1 Tax=Lysobacter capsici AZ78 TaxID=1444315 RepID=A0A108U932_9GAMM|nr:hypothetical protein [Lysobacter capsici]KWS04816.1 hypothetical protein AZ78_2366 [Lysobacter capsici AZ78]